MQGSELCTTSVAPTDGISLRATLLERLARKRRARSSRHPARGIASTDAVFGVHQFDVSTGRDHRVRSLLSKGAREATRCRDSQAYDLGKVFLVALVWMRTVTLRRRFVCRRASDCRRNVGTSQYSARPNDNRGVFFPGSSNIHISAGDTSLSACFTQVLAQQNNQCKQYFTYSERSRRCYCKQRGQALLGFDISSLNEDASTPTSEAEFFTADGTPKDPVEYYEYIQYKIACPFQQRQPAILTSAVLRSFWIHLVFGLVHLCSGALALGSALNEAILRDCMRPCDCRLYASLWQELTSRADFEECLALLSASSLP